ncbi:hypothetical protein GQ607_011988 [Colletotrichum asianum]|uniref:Uncharacterized protein n=1 Tax=Colletotrichum asianum TaxID=702518 RepID=A0A8H3ZI89_9PEZI|nr:hypothetical protein GQ607_011988 [Colletotrichum asianum]
MGPEGEDWGRPRIYTTPSLRPQQSVYLTPLKHKDFDPTQLRQTASTGRLRSKTRSQQDRLAGDFASLQSPSLKPRRLFSNKSASSYHSQESELTTSTIRLRHARDIFEEFGISRPSGWLSDDDEEDFSRHQDGTNSTPRHAGNICHSCGAEVTTRTFCATCGHSVCPQCSSEIPDDENDRRRTESSGHTIITSQQHTFNVTEEEFRSSSHQDIAHSSKTVQNATVASQALKDNPFIVADKMTKVVTAEPRLTDATARGEHQSRFSDCVPQQNDLSTTAGTHGDCGNPKCNAVHAGHHSKRHSIACIVGQQATTDATDKLRPHAPLDDPVQRKIDNMYHHADDLKRTQHIMEHLAAGSAATEQHSSSQVTDRTRTSSVVDVDRLLAKPGINTVNRGRLISLDTAVAAEKKSNRALELREWERSQSFDVDPIKRRASDTPPSPDTRLSNPPEWLSPNRGSITLQRVVTETKSTPQMRSSMDQVGSATTESTVEWPKLKRVTKVTKETVEEKPKTTLPWMQRPLRRVQKEENISQQAQTQQSTEVENWRSQLRKVEDSHHGGRQRAETCSSCHDETSLPSRSSVGEVVDVATHTTKEENQSPAPLRSKRVKEVQASTSHKSSSRTSTTAESETSSQVSHTVKETHSASGSHVVEESKEASVAHGFEHRGQSNEIEVLSPAPVISSEHTCTWKEHYLRLTSEVRQLKAEIMSRERLGSSGVDVGVNVGQGDDELGVEGLTIVMHLKGKDDLVINTDLTRASSDV